MKNNNSITVLVLALLYFFAGKASILLLHGDKIVNIGVFASEGIALGFALYFGKKIWPGVFLGQLALALANSIELVPSLGVSAINSLEVVIAVTLFEKYKLNKELKSFRDMIGLALLIVFVLQVFSSVLSNLVLLSTNQIQSDAFFTSTFSWWFGNVMGQFLFAPFVVLLLIDYKNIDIKDFLLKGFYFSIVIFILEMVFSIKSYMMLLSLTLPAIIFIVAKKGAAYGMLFSIIIAVISAISVYHNTGLFSSGSAFSNALDYNLFVLSHIFTGLTSAILFEQKEKLEKELQETLKSEVLKNKEHQLMMMQQNRMAQMGEMIAMIAHQWRQPLNNLSLINQILISKYKKDKLDDKAIEYFKENSKKQIELMSTTIDDFRSFFKTQKKGKKFYIDDVIKDILDMTKSIYTTKGINVNYSASKKYCCYGYPNDMGQAILNIINNAKDALVDLEVDEKIINITVEDKEGKIIINISDNAGGIPHEIIDKIFDPYFTTKGSKNGTGLGLYMTKMIIQEKFDANIMVKNENNGANFKIFLKKEDCDA